MLATSRQLAKIVPLITIIFIDTLGWFMVAPVLLQLYMPGSESLLLPGVSLATRNVLYGITMALPPLAFILTAPILGAASDKWGRKIILSLCLVLALLGFLIPVFGIVYASMGFILLGRFLGGASTASQPIAQAALADMAQDTAQKALYFSLIALAMTLGLLLGPLLGGYLENARIFHLFSVKMPFYVSAFLALVNLGLIMAFYQPAAQRQQASSVSFSQSVKNFLMLFRRPRLVRLFWLFILLEFAWSLYYQSSFLVLHEVFDYSKEQVANFAATMGVVMCIGLLLIFPLLSQRFALKTLVKCSFWGILLGALGCAFLITPVLQWVFASFIAFFTGMAYVALITLISNSQGRDRQGLVLSTAGVLLAFSWMVSGFVSGYGVNISAHWPALTTFVATALALWCVRKLVPTPGEMLP